MRLHKKLSLTASSILLAVAAMVFSVGGVYADNPPCYQYNANGFQTSQTPVFNNICGVPGVGNESNFVQIRQDSNGNDEDNQNNPNYTVGTLDAACNNGDKFDVWNYLHNDAESQYNDNGSGSAVAHDVQTLLTAELGQTSTQPFAFGDTVSASNAASSVSDTANLNCGGKSETLSLVPGSVHIYYDSSSSWADLPDSTINASTELGSPTPGSGDMWGCWNYRMIIVYQVQVTTPVPPAVTATCNMLGVLADTDRKVTVNKFDYTAVNSSVQSIVINWGDSNTSTITNASSVNGTTHEYANYGSYNIYATMTFLPQAGSGSTAPITSGGAGSLCATDISFTQGQPPVVSPPPSQLVNTGPGSVVGIFAGVVAAASIGYRWMLKRRLGIK